jgi:hypothetical protein
MYCFADLRHLPIHSCQISLHVLLVEKGSTAELAGRQVPHQTTTYRVRSSTQFKSVCFTNDLGAEFND